MTVDPKPHSGRQRGPCMACGETDEGCVFSYLIWCCADCFHPMLLAVHDMQGEDVSCAARSTVCGGSNSPAGDVCSSDVSAFSPDTGRGSTNK